MNSSLSLKRAWSWMVGSNWQNWQLRFLTGPAKAAQDMKVLGIC